MKGKTRPGMVDFNAMNAEKVAQQIIDDERYEKGGLDSSLDSDEFDQEFRDKFDAEKGHHSDENLSSGGED